MIKELILILKIKIIKQHYFLVQKKGYLDICQLLIKKEIDLNLKDINGRTALHYYFMNGNLEICHLLIDYGIKIEINEEENRSPLHISSKKGHLEIYIFLS